MKNIVRKITKISVATLLVACGVNAHAVDPAWVTWGLNVGGNGHQYAVVASSGMTWNQANTQAQNLGGYLATITSAAENNFVFSLLNSSHFTGFNGSGPALGGFNAGTPANPNWRRERVKICSPNNRPRSRQPQRCSAYAST